MSVTLTLGSSASLDYMCNTALIDMAHPTNSSTKDSLMLEPGGLEFLCNPVLGYDTISSARRG